MSNALVPVTGAGGPSELTQLVSFTILNEEYGVEVLKVREVIRISASEIQPPPSMTTGGIEQEFIVGVVNRADRLLILLDPDKMLSQTEQEYIGEC